MRAVVTGGPSVGKTTIVSMLANQGFRVVEEFATQIIKENNEKLLPWVDRSAFQEEVLRRQLEAESELAGYDRPVFLDRGLFDGEAYYILDGIAVPKIFSSLPACDYSIAFLVEELPFFERTDVRRENIEFARQISIILEQCYTSRSVKVVRVPAMSPEDRVNLVLDEVRRFERGERNILAARSFKKQRALSTV